MNIRSLNRGTPRWRIELHASTFPVDQWVPLRQVSGKRYIFVDREEADAELAKLEKVQSHAEFRIVPM